MKKARKDSAGKKVLQQLYCYKQQYIDNFSPLRWYRRSGIFAVLRRECTCICIQYVYNYITIIMTTFTTSLLKDNYIRICNRMVYCGIWD